MVDLVKVQLQEVVAHLALDVIPHDLHKIIAVSPGLLMEEA